jgi:hypothetical protein
VHSGVVGDYVMWITVGTAVIGGVWALTLTRARSRLDAGDERGYPREHRRDALPWANVRRRDAGAAASSHLGRAAPLLRLTLEVGLVLAAQHAVGLVHAKQAGSRALRGPNARLTRGLNGALFGCLDAS